MVPLRAWKVTIEMILDVEIFMMRNFATPTGQAKVERILTGHKNLLAGLLGAETTP